jgi:hypothetical protein
LINLMRNRHIGGDFLDYDLVFETPVGSSNWILEQ